MGAGSSHSTCSSTLWSIRMEMENQISKLQTQLEEAETDLRQSLSEVNQRVEAVAPRLRVENAIKRRPLAAISIAAATGFVLGNSKSRGSLIATLALGLILGFELGSPQTEEE